MTSAVVVVETALKHGISAAGDFHTAAGEGQRESAGKQQGVRAHERGFRAESGTHPPENALFRGPEVRVILRSAALCGKL